MKKQSKLESVYYQIFLLTAMTVGLIGGCTPASFGILAPGQKTWHDCLDETKNQLREGRKIASKELVQECGQPDAVVLGSCFISGSKEIDQWRANTLRVPLVVFQNQEWQKSYIWIYDEKKHFSWPIVDSWRAYLFQIHGDQIVHGWSTYPGWIPWSDSYWDDIKKCQSSRGN